MPRSLSGAPIGRYMLTGRRVDGTLGRRIRQARLRAGWTQTAFARRAGLSRPTVANVETGDRGPASSTLWRIINALGDAEALGPDILALLDIRDRH